MTVPKISVVMAVRDGGAWLDLAVDSILGQNFEEFEFIIVDDGSHDGGPERLLARADRRLRVLRQAAKGLPSALNLGWEACEGALIARMDADDIAAPDRLSQQYAWFVDHPETDILCSDAWLINEFGATIGRYHMPDWSQDNLRAALLYRRRHKPIIHPSVMMRKSVLQKIGGYRNYICSEDHDFWLRALTAGAQFAHVAAPLLFYRINSNGLSAQRARQQANSLASAAANLVQTRNGVDIFLSEPERLNACITSLTEILEKQIIPAEKLSRNIINKRKNNEFLSAAAELCRGILNHGWSLSPGHRHKLLKRLLDDVVEELCGPSSNWKRSSERWT